MKMIPKPYTVRANFKHYLLLLISYQKREKNDSFNPSGKGSKTYYLRAIERYKKYLEKYSDLLTIVLK
jgi:hypothetical protein